MTGVGAASLRSDAPNAGQVQDTGFQWCGTAGGTADDLTLTVTPAIPAYVVGQVFRFKSGASPNTGAATLQISGLPTPGAIEINGAALTAGDIAADSWYEVLVSSIGPAVFQLSALGKKFASGAITTSGLTMATARILGRTTASTGAIEELTVGASLTLSGGSLSGTAASTIQNGIVELLTQAEYDAGTDTTRVPTANLNKIVLGTPTATTSGTAIDFTGIPSGVRQLIMSWVGVSTNGTSAVIIQLGTASGFETTGYVGGNAAANFSTGFAPDSINNASGVRSGQCIFTLENSSSNTWAFGGAIGRSDAAGGFASGGYKTLSDILTQIRLTAINGTDAFDAGAVNISYIR